MAKVEVVIEPQTDGSFHAKLHRDWILSTAVTGTGCPLGRGSLVGDAMNDLARRARLDGGSLQRSDMVVRCNGMDCESVDGETWTEYSEALEDDIERRITVDGTTGRCVACGNEESDRRQAAAEDFALNGE